MAGRGVTPKQPDQRHGAHVPQRGDWVAAVAIGWQHGDVPEPPKGLSATGRETWVTWMGSWFAAHWLPSDLPGLRVVIKLYARVWSGRCTGSERTELRQLMDTYGITPKGQQDRRWSPPKSEDQPAAADGPPEKKSRYGHLRSVG